MKVSRLLKGMLAYLMAQRGVTPNDIDRMLEGDLKEEACFCDVTPRLMMQTLGTDWGRELLGAGFWVRMAEEDIAEELQRGNSVVVDDIRFQNEVDMIRRLGGTVVHVVRPVQDRNPGEHKSEGQDLRPDAVIWNGGSLPEFHDKITRMFT